MGPTQLKVLDETDGRLLAILGTSAFLLGAVLLVMAEALGIADGRLPYPPIVAYVVLAFLGQAARGGALLQSGVLPAWIGWAAIAWNLGLVVIMATLTPGDVYFPVLHHVLPLLVGVTLLLGIRAT